MKMALFQYLWQNYNDKKIQLPKELFLSNSKDSVYSETATKFALL